MRSAWLLLSVLPLAIGCSTHAFTPSARPMPLSPMQAPKLGESDVQLDGNATGEVLGPGITAGNLRYRRGVTDEVALTGDVGLIRVHDENQGISPHAGTGRVGVQIHGDATDEIVAAAFMGAGGGYAPEAGGWLSGDIGAGFSGTHRYIRPTLVVDVYASEPVATKLFSVGDTMRRLPRTVGLQTLVGFDLGHIDRSVMVGFTFARLWSAENDTQEADSADFIGLGGGFRFGAI